MSKLSIVQIGVLLFAICLTREAVSNNSTDPTAGGNSTSNPNATTMATGTLSSSTNTTSPTGAGVSLHAASTFPFLIPLIMAASLLQHFC